MKQKSKRKFLENEFKKAEGNSKNLWKVLNTSILGKEQKNNSQKIFLEINDQINDQ